MDKNSLDYFKTLLYKKTHRARILDFLLLRLFLSIMFFGLFSFSVTKGAAAVLAILSVIAFSMILEPIKQKRLKKFSHKKIAALKKKALLEHIVLLNKEDAQRLLSQKCIASFRPCNEGIIEGDTLLTILDYHPSETVQPGALLAIRRVAISLGCNKMEVFSCANYSQNSLELSQSLDIKTILHGQRELMTLAEKLNLLPTDDAVKQTIDGYIEGLSQKRKKARLSLLAKENSHRYFYCSIAISLASLITGYKIYYPLISTICIALAAICYARGQKEEKVA